MSIRCRLGIHDWSIETLPFRTKWCFRCGKRWPS